MKRKKSQFLFYLFLFLNQCTYLIYAISQKYPFRNTDYNQINLFLMNMSFSLTIILFFSYAREIAASAALEVKLRNMQEIKKLQDTQSHLIRKKNREAAAYQKEMLLKLKKSIRNWSMIIIGKLLIYLRVLQKNLTQPVCTLFVQTVFLMQF